MTTSPIPARLIKWLLVLIAVGVSLFPFYWMLRTALAPQSQQLADGLGFWPAHLDFGNFARAWNKANRGQALLNGLIITGAILLLQLITCVPAAYVFAKIRFKGSGILFGVVLACLLIPTQATMVPTFIGINLFGLGDTRIGLVLPFYSSAFGIFLLRQQMLSIPDALLDAAKTDGLGPWRTLLRVVVPMSMPSIAAFAIFSVFTHWNDYLWPLLVARSPDLATPPLRLAVFQQADIGFDYSALAAGAAIVTAPILILFLFAQRRFVQGMAGGEIAG
ncbi:carbohydrate ABC transporter permease [Candidatus Frankia alpina]|uniref:Carbohydrate ABC transporter permease n=1 Tax=Candidatus Frankia alpina TaxID=2699483 RepID=A0A4S5CVS8_9ACTN|nr:carbohydrate ABC transporter permease [Candidatus Frankia alpina]THJ49193.1 carbohydrate ABC transporter permease [Candidatus Frankia alpina]